MCLSKAYCNIFSGDKAWIGFNWDPIAKLVLKTRYKKFNKVLKKVNFDYLENSKKLLKKYPDEASNILVIKEKQAEMQMKNLKNTSITDNKNLDSLISQLFFERINKMKHEKKMKNMLICKTTALPKSKSIRSSTSATPRDTSEADTQGKSFCLILEHERNLKTVDSPTTKTKSKFAKNVSLSRRIGSLSKGCASSRMQNLLATIKRPFKLKEDSDSEDDEMHKTMR